MYSVCMCVCIQHPQKQNKLPKPQKQNKMPKPQKQNKIVIIPNISTNFQNPREWNKPLAQHLLNLQLVIKGYSLVYRYKSCNFTIPSYI